MAIKKSLLWGGPVLLLSFALSNSVHAGWNGLLDSFNKIKMDYPLSFNQKLVAAGGAFAFTAGVGYLYKKRVDTTRRIKQERQREQLQELIGTVRQGVSFEEFKRKCDGELPPFQLQTNEFYRSKDNKGIDDGNTKKAVTAEELHQVIDNYFAMLPLIGTFDADKWVNKDIPKKLPTMLRDKQYSEIPAEVFDPHVQKLILPDDSKVILFGDRHGDVHALLQSLKDLSAKGFLDENNPFKINDPNVYIGFLGDYTDRGWYGAEVLYTILRLKCENPHNVFMVRGNHEDLDINKKEKTNSFYSELIEKFKEDFAEDTSGPTLVQKIAMVYETLPLATFIGCIENEKKTIGQKLLSYFYNTKSINFASCFHGGLEVGFDPIPLMSHSSSVAFTKFSELKRKTQINKLFSIKSVVNLFIEAGIKDLETLKNNFGDYLAGQLYDCTMYQIKTVMRHITEGSNSFRTTDIKEERGYEESHLLYGFLWNDYETNENIEEQASIFVRNSSGRAWILGKTFCEAVRHLCFIASKGQLRWCGDFRGHQHCNDKDEPMMARILNGDDRDHEENKGIGRLWIPQNVKDLPKTKFWKNFVYTFNVSPNTPYQEAGFKFDTYGVWTLKEKFEDWKMETVRVSMQQDQEK